MKFPSVLSFYHELLQTHCFLNAAAKLLYVWLRKKTFQSIWYLCVHLIESIGGPWETTKGGKG